MNQELFFVTGNDGKFSEVREFIPELQRVSLDLPEIQSLDPEEVIAAKLKEASLNNPERNFLVEDTSLYLDCVNGFPGPLIKWLMESVGCEGIANLALKYENTHAWAETVIGYIDSRDQEPSFFRGRLNGFIVAPRGGHGFGWDSIFQPEGHRRTLAEMTSIEKNDISMRRLAAQKLKEFLVLQ